MFVLLWVSVWFPLFNWQRWQATGCASHPPNKLKRIVSLCLSFQPRPRTGMLSCVQPTENSNGECVLLFLLLLLFSPRPSFDYATLKVISSWRARVKKAKIFTLSDWVRYLVTCMCVCVCVSKSYTAICLAGISFRLFLKTPEDLTFCRCC